MKAIGRLVLTAVVTAVTIPLVLTGCSQQRTTGSGISDKEQLALTQWRDSLDQSLADPALDSATAAGFSEGGGALDAPAGRSDLLVACNGAAKLKFTASSTKTGDSAGSVTVACGATERVELNMVRAKDLSFAVEPVKGGALPGASDQSTVFWYASVVTPGFAATAH